jgi:putative peptide zinc metalloprotease protein
VPTFKLFKYLTVEPELHRKRGRAWLFTGAVTALIVVLVGIIPFPERVRGEGILQPKEKKVLYDKQAGFVKEIPPGARDGEPLKKGDVIMVLDDPELKSNLEETKANLAAAQYRMRAAAASSDTQAEARVQQLKVDTYRKELEDRQRRFDELTIKAPIDGYLVAPDIENFVGRYYQVGEEICTVQDTDHLEVRGTIAQSDAQLVTRRPPEWDKLDKLPIEVRTVGRANVALPATAYTVVPQATKELPAQALTSQGGGEVAPDPKDPSGTKAQNPEFELRVDLMNPNNEYIPGQRAYVRMTVRKTPLMRQWYRAVLQLIQARKESGNQLAKQ